MSKNFEKIKGYYDNCAWTKQQVFNVVGKAAGITEEEYEQITGTPYKEETYPEPVVGVVHLHDFSMEVEGALLPITSDEPITSIDFAVPVDMHGDWAVASLSKYEFFNGETRIDSIVCYQFSMNGQKVLRCGFRTSGTQPKAFTKVQGALLLKRR